MTKRTSSKSSYLPATIKVLDEINKDWQARLGDAEARLNETRRDLITLRRQGAKPNLLLGMTKLRDDLALELKDLRKRGLEKAIEARVNAIHETVAQHTNKILYTLGTWLDVRDEVCPAVLSALEKVGEACSQAQERVRKSRLKDDSQSVSELQQALVTEEAYRGLARNVTRVGITDKIVRGKAMKVNSLYPLSDKRVTLSKKCVKSSRKQLMQAARFGLEDVEMFSLFVQDCRDHYRLGAAILNGQRDGIEQASDMDTASREALPNDVWDFVTVKIYDDTYKRTRAKGVGR